MCTRGIPENMEMQHHCPVCDEEQTFHLMASVEIHLGRKKKWYCGECDYEMVTIDGIDSTEAAPA